MPASTDSVSIPTASLYPVLTGNVAISDIRLANGASLGVASFGLTIAGNVLASSAGAGGITGNTGRLTLTGSAKSVSGIVPGLQVTGGYSLGGALNVIGALRVTGSLNVTAPLRISRD